MLAYYVHILYLIKFMVMGFGTWMGPIWLYSEDVFNLRKCSCLLHLRHGCDVHKTLYFNCEFHDPLVSCSGHLVGRTILATQWNVYYSIFCTFTVMGNKQNAMSLCDNVHNIFILNWNPGFRLFIKGVAWSWACQTWP